MRGEKRSDRGRHLFKVLKQRRAGWRIDSAFNESKSQVNSAKQAIA
jgi:hypothetical protein